MNELALFAGAGGGLLASRLAGWRTICAVELDWYCRCALVQRQNDGALNHFPIWDDVRSFDGKPWGGIVDVVSGGFPCQAYSTAAAGRNKADDLWPEMRRIVADVTPRYVFAENVNRKAIDAAADDLEAMGYETRSIELSAADMGGDHVRGRCWLLAYTDDPRELLRAVDAEMAVMQGIPPRVWSGNAGEPRVSDGVAYRMERIAATGNGQVPIVALGALVALCGSKD